MMKDVLELDNGEMMDKWDHRWYQYSRALKEYRLDMLPKREWVTSIEVYWGLQARARRVARGTTRKTVEDKSE